MNRKQIIKKCIEIAIEHRFGYKGEYYRVDIEVYVPEEIYYDYGNVEIRWWSNGQSTHIKCGVMDLFTDEEFLIALHGEEDRTWATSFAGIELYKSQPEWELQRQKFIEAEDRIDYLRKWLDKQ